MKYLTPEEFADRFSLSRDAVYRGLRSKRIPGVKICSRWRIPRKVVYDFEARANSSDPMPGDFEAEVRTLRRVA